MIAELLEALSEAALAIEVWPDREEPRWRWVYWTFGSIFALIVFALAVVFIVGWH